MNYLIVVNAYIKNLSQINQAERIAEELRLLGADCQIKKNINLAYIIGGKVVSEKYDGCVFLDKDRAAARLLEKSGLKLFNSAEAIEICDDKMLTHIALSNNGIPMPDCVYSPLCYYEDAEIDESFLVGVEQRLSFPLVAKKCYGSLGAGVYQIKDKTELRAFEEQNKLCAHFYQKFIGSGGEDIRVIVIGGKFVCAMKRKNEKDFRSNVELGGRGEAYIADKPLKDLCERVAQTLKLDYCGIDILTDNDGKRYVCEVNSNAFFAEAERVCGVNIAKKYAQLIIKGKNA
ncbi:MAG: RimK family alpha-L-glutamate ligase [Clostridia bacterium]|nr:RimK family alpha-L-glutamate ligase [Clostridia bacterium]